MKVAKVEPVPALEAMMRIAQMPRTGYVVARFPKHVAGRKIWVKAINCWYHFACFALGHYLPGPGTKVELQYHWDQRTRQVALDAAVAEMFRQDKLQLLRVTDYDDRYRSECYYCNAVHGRVRGRDICGDVLYKNSATGGLRGRTT